MERRLTVLVPTYCGLPFLLETLASLQRQTLRDFELLVLDDHSTDGTAKAAEQFRDPRFRVLRGERNLGLTGNWNRALQHVQTPYFALCHQDDVYEPEFLEALLDLLLARPDAFIAHCKVQSIDESSRPVRAPAERYKERYWPSEEPYERSIRAELNTLRRGNYIVMPAVLYRTQAIRKIGMFRPDYRFAADWEYWLRGLLAGFTITGTCRRLVRYRRHPGMTTRKTEADLSRYREELQICRWIASAAVEAGLDGDPRPDYRIVTHTLLSDLARRLRERDTASARGLLQFAAQHIPGFRRSPKHRMATAALALGRTGGKLLQGAESFYLWLLDASRGQTRTLPRRLRRSFDAHRSKPSC